VRSFIAAGVLILSAAAAAAAGAQHEHHQPADSAGSRVVRGTLGGWSLMATGSAFLLYDRQSTPRGDTQFGWTDWEMLMADRPVAAGRLQLRAMTSVEALSLGAHGYPLLLQTGGTDGNSVLHDRQHAQSLPMELAVAHEQPMGAILTSLYAGAVGEPALGPAAYMHRASAQHDPLAPIGHHWQDATHQSFGVATAGVSAHGVKLEGSAFNAREPGDDRLSFYYRGARLDSYAGRLSWSTTPQLSVSAWWGYLVADDRLDPISPMHRYGVSLTNERVGVAGGAWATTLVWGMNVHHHEGVSHALAHGDPNASPHHHASSLLAETDLGLGTRDAVFGRIERVMKSGEDLGFLGGDLTQLYDVRSVAAGYAHEMLAFGAGALGIGARGAIDLLPETLRQTYGTRTPVGAAVYLQVRPRRQ
jgi:hypothetical protein